MAAGDVKDKDAGAGATNASAEAGTSKESSSKDSTSKKAADKDNKDKAEKSSSTSANLTAAASSSSSSASTTASASAAMTTAAVMDYLKSRGFQRAEAAFKAEMKALSAGKSPEQAQSEGMAAAGAAGPRTMSMDELAAKSAPRDAAGPSQGDNAGGVDLEELAVEALKIDKTDRIRGFGMIRSWCEGGLDAYQAELRPLLLPLFVHSYLDFISMSSESAAFSLYALHSSSLLPQHLSIISHLRSVTMPSHISADETVQRFRSERYVLKMSQTVFGLLLGWLTDGAGPIAGAGAAEGVGGETGEGPATRGRLAMLRIINERCRIQVLKAKPYELTPAVLEEGTGLTGAGPSYSAKGRPSRQYPTLQQNAVTDGGDAVAEFNAKNAGPQLKLGPDVPMNERLKEEVTREVEEELEKEKADRMRIKQEEAQGAGSSTEEQAAKTEEAMEGVETGDTERLRSKSPRSPGRELSRSRRASSARSQERSPSRVSETPAPSGKGTASMAPLAASGKDGASSLLGQPTASDLLQPTLADLPPQPPLFRTVDIMREVAKVRDARKALRIDPKMIHKASSSAADGDADLMRRSALPSICAYTYHEAQDGLTSSTFSEDLSLMAAGFEESYVQVWSLKGQSLRGLRGDMSLSGIRDSATLNGQRSVEDADLPTRKLIGHSAPVYSLSFDPIGGSAIAPRTLLSASGDSTVRLWSMDTFSALVAYRGHQGPVWDVEYGPNGIYFATAGMDKTARLWSTERINPLRMYAGHLSDVDCLSFHPNSLYLATGSSDRTCRLWDVQRGVCVRLFVGHSSPVSVCKISPDGRYLASAGSGSPAHFPGNVTANPLALGSEDEATISIWDLGSGKRIKKMWGHSARVHAMDFSNDGGLLVTSSQDSTVRCWDVKSAGGIRKATKASAPAEGGASTAVTADPSGPGSLDGSISSAASPATMSSSDCIATFRTRKTPMVDVRMTRRNLCLVAGAFQDD